MKVAVKAQIRIAGPGYSLWPGEYTIVDDDDVRVARQIERGALTVVDDPFGLTNPPGDQPGPDPDPPEPPAPWS